MRGNKEIKTNGNTMAASVARAAPERRKREEGRAVGVDARKEGGRDAEMGGAGPPT